jgi:hypothetical protein
MRAVGTRKTCGVGEGAGARAEPEEYALRVLLIMPLPVGKLPLDWCGYDVW